MAIRSKEELILGLEGLLAAAEAGEAIDPVSLRDMMEFVEVSMPESGATEDVVLGADLVPGSGDALEGEEDEEDDYLDDLDDDAAEESVTPVSSAPARPKPKPKSPFNFGGLL